MKKSTIFLLVVVYIIAFFAVGLYGVRLKSHYSFDYLNEIKVTPAAESGLVEQSFTTEELGSKDDLPTYKVIHEYRYKVKYTTDMVIKFTVELNPSNTTNNDFLLSYTGEKGDDSDKLFKVSRVDATTLYVTDISKPTALVKTSIEFTLEDPDKNGVRTTVYISVGNK